jgi:hypothetical protein
MRERTSVTEEADKATMRTRCSKSERRQGAGRVSPKRERKSGASYATRHDKPSEASSSIHFAEYY